MFLGSLYCKQHRPRSDCSLGYILFASMAQSESEVYFNICSRRGVLWLSDRVLRLEFEGFLVRDSLEALHCVLEQDNLSSA